jgi:hypothetical protein
MDTILGFLGPQDLRIAEVVCRDWRTCVHLTNQWEKQCKYKLGLADKTNSKNYLPEGQSYKEIFRLISPRIHDRAFYRRYIGDIGPIPQIPEEISPKNWYLPDRCDQSKKIGEEYVWVPFPSHVTITVPEDSALHLNGPDDPANPEAPRLILQEDDPSFLALSKDSAVDPIRVQSRNKVLKVPVTLNNLDTVMSILSWRRNCEEKIRNTLPKNYNYTLSLPYVNCGRDVTKQHGNKRMVAGWGCMRKNVTEKNRTLVQQQTSAADARVQLTNLLRRVWFNIFEHANSCRTHARRNRCIHNNFGVYADNPSFTFARTSTLIRDNEGNLRHSTCGGRDEQLDFETYGDSYGGAADDEVGIAVELSGEVERQLAPVQKI